MVEPAKQMRWIWLLLISFIVLSGCGGNRYAEEVQVRHKTLVVQFDDLKTKLDGNQLRNAVIARDYAGKLITLKPEMAAIVATLRTDTTSNGVMYQSLFKRLNKINLIPKSENEYRQASSELLSLEAGSDPIVFNESLIDIVNTLADLSDGQLPRINIPKSSSTEQTTPGSYLVGNSNYGSWQKDNSGSSFWQFYGQYALFRDLMSPSYGYRGGPIYRDNWYDRPRHSYHHDYGRSTYGTTSQQRSWGNTAKDLKSRGKNVVTNKKDYRSSAAKRRSSTYSQMSSKQYGAKSASSSSASSAKRSSTYSQYGASSRGSSSGSRSFRSGK